jgi:hypothetical protein
VRPFIESKRRHPQDTRLQSREVDARTGKDCNQVGVGDSPRLDAASPALLN